MTFDVLEGQERWQVHARATDLSPSGIQLERPDSPPYQVDSIVPMELHVPGRAAPLPVNGILVWTQGNRAGFEFVAINESDRLELAELVDRLTSEAERSGRRLAAVARYFQSLTTEDDEN